MITSRGYYFLITAVVLLDIAKCSIFGDGYFKHGKLWNTTRPTILDPVKEQWIEQKLDHFDSNEQRTWKQRYSVNDKLVSDDRNVAFLKIGGESPLEPFEVHTGAFYSYAQKFQPILFTLEHRYYGASRPTENVSTKNLKYLSSKQALADLAFFIESMNKLYNLSSDVKWIVFGGSYAGSLAAWARELYPNLVYGAVSSSGPLLAKVDYDGYFKVVADALRISNEKCPDMLQEGYKQLEDLLNDAENRHQINDIFNLCDDIEDLVDKPLRLSKFFMLLADTFGATVQYNKTFLIHTDDLCNIVLNETLGSEIHRLGGIGKVTAMGGCLNTDYDAMIQYEKEEEWTSTVATGERQWFYQTCTEFGFFQTSSHEPHVFGNRFNVDYFIQQCEEIHGPEFNKTFLESAVKATNDLYHGYDINVTNTVFIHGSLDPWHLLGIYEARSPDAPVILLEGYSHCVDIVDPSDYDPPELKAARAKVVELISEWLKK